MIPQDFARAAQAQGETAPLLVVTDGAEPNTANFVENYVRGAGRAGCSQRAAATRQRLPRRPSRCEPRFWFNPSAESRNYLIPGSITIIMTVIGALLTSLVVAREWERGTMEALLASPVTRAELLLSKLLPYYVLGIVSLFICVVRCRFSAGGAFPRLGLCALAGRIALPGQRAGAGPVALHRHAQPVQCRAWPL